jgi:hypothetical protein
MPYYPYTFRSDPAGDPASTDTYAAVPITEVTENALVDYFTCPSSGPISANWKNTGANTIKVKVLAANDPAVAEADRAEVVAEDTIAAAANKHITIDLATYGFYWFMQAANAGGSQGASHIRGRHARI